MPTETEAAPATQTTTEMPSPMQETPSSTVENLPQNGGEDFATWLSDRLDNFQKGQETPPWEQQKEESKKEEQEVKGEAEQEEEGEPSEDAEETSKPEDEEDDSEETKNMSSAAGAKFKELKAELKSYKAKVAEAIKIIEESKSTPQNSEELEALRARVAEYEQEIAVTRVEATPEYKRAVIEPTQAILDTASAMAERYKIDARKLVNALREESVSEGSDALTELAADFSERDRVRLYRMADDLSDVSRRRDHLRENASRANQERQERIQAEEAQREKEYRENAARVAEKTWAETFSEHPVLSKLEKEALSEIKAAGSESDLLESTPDERAYAVYAGVALPHIVKKFEAATARVAELEQALSKYKKASPKASGNTDTSPTIVESGGFLDAIEKRFTNG